MGLETRIWASRLRFGPRGGGDGEEEEGEGEGEGEISPMCENIGHLPLWGRCPKSTTLFENAPLVRNYQNNDDLILNNIEAQNQVNGMPYNRLTPKKYLKEAF